MTFIRKILFTIFPMLTLLSSCSDFLDIQPTGKVIAQTGEEYRELLTSVYYNFPDDRSLTTLRTDELLLDPATTVAEDLNTYFDIWRWNDITQDENTASFSWRRFYHSIYIANYIIEHQHEITQATPAEISQLVGESYMMRSYCHLILVTLFGQDYTHCNPSASLSIPLCIKADVDAVLTRSTVAKVYQQILADIDSAATRMNVETWEPTLSYRFNALSAKALRSRACLYMGKWAEAMNAAEEVIRKHPDLEDLTQSGYVLPDHYTSKEAIVSLEKVMKPAYKAIGTPNVEFINSYRNGDMRKSRFFKAKTSKIYEILKGGTDMNRSTFRSAEAYLTAAECAIRLGEKERAISYMEPLITHRYIKAMGEKVREEMSEMSDEELLRFILEERHHEFAYEGHRWFDLRRTTQQSITKTFNNETYTLQEDDARYTLPIPTEAISSNPNLATE